MNKKGQVALVNIMIGLVFIFCGLLFINPIKVVLTDVMSSTQLDCSNSSISDGQKLTCLATDIILPYFIIVVIGIGVAYMSYKWVGL